MSVPRLCNWRAFWVKASSGSTEAAKETAAPRSKNAIDAIAASTRDVVDTSIQGQIASQIGAKASAENSLQLPVMKKAR